MNNLSKTVLAATIGIAAGSALGILLAPDKGDQKEDQSGGKSCQDKYKAKLIFVRGKMLKHRERLDQHLVRINAKIEALNVRAAVKV